MSETFWQEVRRTLMIRGDGWRSIIEQIPDVMSYHEIRPMLISKTQLEGSGFKGLGYIAGLPVTATLEPSVIHDGLRDYILNFESCSMLWLYQYYLIEALSEHWRTKPLAEWPPAHLGLVIRGLHFMVYMAAMMVLFTEDSVWTKEPVSYGLLEYTAHDVRETVREAAAGIHPKAQDYGESFRRHGLPGLVPRLWDKIARIAQLKADDRPANFEKFEDSVRDLLGYSIISFSLVMEMPEEVRNGTAQEEENTDPVHDEGNATNHTLSECGPECEEPVN
jgi:hypothetical protein